MLTKYLNRSYKLTWSPDNSRGLFPLCVTAYNPAFIIANPICSDECLTPQTSLTRPNHLINSADYKLGKYMVQRNSDFAAVYDYASKVDLGWQGLLEYKKKIRGNREFIRDN